MTALILWQSLIVSVQKHSGDTVFTRPRNIILLQISGLTTRKRNIFKTLNDVTWSKQKLLHYNCSSGLILVTDDNKLKHLERTKVKHIFNVTKHRIEREKEEKKNTIKKPLAII